MKTRYEGVYVCISSWMIVLMLMVVMFIAGYSGNFGLPVIPVSDVVSSSPEPAAFVDFKFPSVELLTKLNTQGGDNDDDRNEFRGVSSDDDHRSSSSSNSSVLARNQTIIRRYGKLEQGLARARAAIRKASLQQNVSTTIGSGEGDGDSDTNFVSNSIYRNPGAFHRSYLEMEKRFKVYVYEEGELPIVHDGPCKDLYTIEGRFIHEMERGQGRKFITKNGEKAHVYFMPFSVTWMVKYLYKPLTYDVSPLKAFVSDYVKVISTKHPFWNRTHAADHFMLSCHDWGPHASKGNPLLYNSSIRVLCNANSSEGFNPQKDVSLPEIYLYSGTVSSKLQSPPPNSPRPHLAFFSGGVHGPIRPLLLNHWKGRDTDLQVFEYLPKNLDYYSFMLTSKYCLCPSGHEVASPRIVEAIYSECVPVIISDHYVLPFSDVLNWDAFSINVRVSDIPRLKEILRQVSEEKYLKLKQGVRDVKKHFWLDKPAKRYDVFHMILHSIWLRRLNLKLT